MTQTTIFNARQIITMNPARPFATHLAIRGDRILGTGTLEELAGWGPYTLDERFKDKVLMPGLVEGHSHLLEGSLWRFPYVGYHDRMAPDGKIWPGSRSLDAVIKCLQEQELQLSDPKAPLVAWGFDPIYFGKARCTRHDLDKVSKTRPVLVAHASLHIVNANSAALESVDWLRTGIDFPGILLGEDGLPTGELRGVEAMGPVSNRNGFDRSVMAGDALALRRFAQLCVRKGVTTATDLANPLPDEAVPMMLSVTGEADYPTRIVSLLRFLGKPPADVVKQALWLKSQSNDRLRLGHIKIVADGSIQGFSARMRAPGYFNGAPNGLWYTAPEQIQRAYELALANDLLIHTHTNGDEATEMALDCMEKALRKHPSPDHRFTLQHCQLADAAQFRRMAKLGMCVNLFSNHHFYWGDQHYAMTVGPDRAERMNACRTALDNGVALAVHSDAPVTPLGPLFTAWCAIHRQTSSGRVLGEHERISPMQALHAVTLGPAYTLKLDSEIGSLETGKRADVAVLDEDPLQIDPMKIKDIAIWGVIQGGRIFEAGAAG